MYDFLVEDPSPEFVALRDYVDCQNALKLQCFRIPQILEPYSTEIEKECQSKLKMNKVHVLLHTYTCTYYIDMYIFTSLHLLITNKYTTKYTVIVILDSMSSSIRNTKT